MSSTPPRGGRRSVSCRERSSTTAPRLRTRPPTTPVTPRSRHDFVWSSVRAISTPIPEIEHIFDHRHAGRGATSHCVARHASPNAGDSRTFFEHVF